MSAVASAIASAAAIARSLRGMHLILRDEGNDTLSRVMPEENFRVMWSVQIPPGRDLGLDASGAIVAGTASGYEERDALTGGLIRAETGFPGTLAACRLEGGITLLSSIEDGQGSGGSAAATGGTTAIAGATAATARASGAESRSIVLRFVTGDGSVFRTIVVPGYGYLRLVRPTPSGGFVLTSNRLILELDCRGEVKTRFGISSELAEAHAWKAVKLPSGEFLVATGYQAELQIFDSGGRRLASIRGPEPSRPWFYCDFHELPDGKTLVVNWQGHGPGHGDSGEQLLVFSREGDSGPDEWSYLGGWRPGAAGGFSSIQSALPIFQVSDLPL